VTQIVTFSELMRWVRCPASWRFRYQLRVKPRPPTPLTMSWGSLMHAAIERIRDGEDGRELIAPWLGERTDEAQRADQNPWNPMRDSADYVENAAALAKAARWHLDYYTAREVSRAYLHQALWLEQPFLVSVPDRSGRSRGDLWLLGVLDEVSMLEGDPCVVERKTTGVRDLRKFQTGLDHDVQVPGYAYAVQELLGLPRLPAVEYDVLRRGMPATPKLVGNGSKRSPYRLDFRVKDTTWGQAADHLARERRRLSLEEPDALWDEEKIQAYVDVLGGPASWQDRYQYEIRSQQVLEWQRTVTQVARSIRQAGRTPGHGVFADRSECSRWGCAYKEVCWAQGSWCGIDAFEACGYEIEEDNNPTRHREVYQGKPVLTTPALVKRAREMGLDAVEPARSR